MKRQGTWLIAGIVALLAASCFSDPTDSLHNGPALLQVNRSAVTLINGDSIAVQAEIKDEAGQTIPATDVTWETADPSIADVRVDTDKPAPGAVFTRAFVRGVTNQAGVTTVYVTVNGIKDSVRVTVTPSTFPGTVAITGTAGADTFTVGRPAPLPPLVTVYNAGDTLVVTATATVAFDPAATTVTFGAVPGYMVSRTATVLKAVARQPFLGKPTVNNLIYAGTAATGPIAIASLKTDSVQIQHGRFRGTAVTGASAFGPNTVIVIKPAAGKTFSNGGTAATTSTVTVGSTPAIILGQTTDTISAIVPAALTASVMVTLVKQGTVVYDSLRANTQTTVAASTFPGTVTTAGGTTNLLDTIYVDSLGGASFTASGANASTVTIGGVPTLVVGTRTAGRLKVLAGRAANGPLSITNVVVAGVTIPALQTAGNVVVNGTVTGEANEPANNTEGGTVITLGTAASPRIIYGSVSDAGDPNDFYTFTIAATTTVSLSVAFTGSGAGGDSNGDLDLLVENAALACCVGGTGGATAAQPQTLTISNLAAGTYHIWVNGYDTGGQNHTYRLIANGP